MSRVKKNKISVLNWIGTLLLCSIPGVNLIALICFCIFAKSPSKRSFAIAQILLMVIGFALVAAAFIAFPEVMATVADVLRDPSAVAVIP